MAEEEQDVNEDEMNGEDDISEVRKCQFKGQDVSYFCTLPGHTVCEFPSYY